MRTASLLAAALVTCSAAFAGENECMHMKLLATPAPAGFDAESGRNLRNFPPHRLVDAQRMQLEITIPDMNTPKFSAVQRLTVTAMGLRDIPQIQLDAVGLIVDSVSADGRDVSFTQSDGLLRLSFSPALKAGESVTLTTNYRVESPQLGLIWTPESPAWPGRPAQIHTQGQPETNSYWFPCLDFPSERLATELTVNVPEGYEVLSNGRLESRTTLGRTATFHWVQDKPHVNYLVSMVVGKFDIVDVGTRDVPMPVYAPLGRKYDVAGTFGRTKDMVSLFEKLTGHTYPWDKYAQSVVWNFGAGGMENTSCTTLHESSIISREAQLDYDIDGLISHELAHQWFGDLVTCNSWEHIWLNEGFATYFSSLWFEHRDGADAYFANIRGNFDGVIAADRAPAPEGVGMASKVNAHPWEPFRRAANPYGKGSSVLHMLRVGLGDDLFFKGIKLYLDRRAFKTAETIDLRTAFEDVSGKDLRQFFRQWVERPGVPRLKVDTRWSSGQLSVSITQTQQIDGDNPAFEFALPVVVAEAGSAPRVERIAVTGRSREVTIPCATQPLYVAVDPALALLAEMNVSQPIEAWREQAAKGVTSPARIAALRELERQKDTAFTAAAGAIAADPKEPVSVRVAATRYLSAAPAPAQLSALMVPDVDRWEVREAAVEGARRLTGDALATAVLVESLATRDPSQKVRAAAIRSLGAMKAPGAGAIIEQAIRSDSHEDGIRLAAIDALTGRPEPEALATAIRLTGPSYLPRTRARAAAAVVQFAGADRTGAYDALVAMLDTHEVRTRLAAGQALVDLGDERALTDFDRLLGQSPTKDVAWTVGSWKRALSEKLGK
ncbi:MAG: M1 family aminopeptidase [Phycisphaerales bacterium]